MTTLRVVSGSANPGLAAAIADRLDVVDPHTEALEAISPVPVEVLTAVPLLSEAAAPARSGRTIVVAPDLGAAKLAEQFAASMQDSVAIVRKFRIRPLHTRCARSRRCWPMRSPACTTTSRCTS
ncbi:hypothetical protein [Nocardia nepalensis]|uniref:hypothetical protein n=1 Tax=Nocardia nepalensis TaxID=3375448 RepID=UPI003B678622